MIASPLHIIPEPRSPDQTANTVSGLHLARIGTLLDTGVYCRYYIAGLATSDRVVPDGVEFRMDLHVGTSLVVRDRHYIQLHCSTHWRSNSEWLNVAAAEPVLEALLTKLTSAEGTAGGRRM